MKQDSQSSERREELPEGHEQIAMLVREADALLHDIAKHELNVAEKRNELNVALMGLGLARTKEAAVVARLRALIAHGKCCPENGCTHGEVALPVPTARPLDPMAWLDDASLPIVWRIGWMLADYPVLDYQATALRLYGPTDYKTAKNRVNGHLTQLRMHGVIDTLGNNRFRVDIARLAEKSGRVVPEGASMT